MKIKLYTWTSDTDSGMSTETFASKEALHAAILETVEANDGGDEDYHGRLKALPFESDEWEELYEEWRDGATYGNDYFSYDEHEVEAPDDPRVAKLQEMCRRLRNSIRHAAHCKAPSAFPCTCDADELWESSAALAKATGNP